MNVTVRPLGNPRLVTKEKAEAMQAKAIAFLENIDADDPNDIAGMSVEEYAEHKHLELSNNPGAENLAQYTRAVLVHQRGSHDPGGLVIHQTPPDRRSHFSKEIWRRRRQRGTDRR
jgi:hypothetical protein